MGKTKKVVIPKLDYDMKVLMPSELVPDDVLLNVGFVREVEVFDKIVFVWVKPFAYISYVGDQKNTENYVVIMQYRLDCVLSVHRPK